jgi:hypothetical protein
LNARWLTLNVLNFRKETLMRKVKMMLATFAITFALTTPLFAAVAGRCSKTLIVDTGGEIVSCDLTTVYLDGNGNIVGCGYSC